MNITESTIYWLSRLDHIHESLSGWHTFFCIALVVATIASLILFLISLDEELGKYQAVWRRQSALTIKLSMVFFICATFCSSMNTFLPTTKEMCAIKVIPAIANNQSVKELGEGVVNLAKEWMNELQPKSAAKDN